MVNKCKMTNKFIQKCVPPILILGLVTLVQCQVNNYRLPTTTKPIEYTISLNTSLDLDVFYGQVEIKIAVNTATSEIIINQYNLDIHVVKLFKVQGDNALDIPIQKTVEQYSLRLQLETNDATLEVGKEYILKITYTGYYQNTRIGIYKSMFTDEAGNTVPMISTNFFPYYARYAFPCYDEPQFKAPFIISIQYPVEFHALSNMAHFENDTISDSRLVKTTFKTTPLLSTHSIAFAISRYKSFCNQTKVKICVHYDALHTQDDVKLALEIAEDTIEELEKYLGVALGLHKLDIIPVADTPNEIIGNYGLLINDENQHYYNPESSSMEQKDLVIRHTIRQIINIYFINIITPEWWTDAWIHQGVTIIIEHIVADKLYPAIDATGQFIDSVYRFGFVQDKIKPTGDLLHQDIVNLFNGERQYKSAGIMHMFKGIVGDQTFIEGLKELLTNEQKSYSSETFFNTFQNRAVVDGFIPDSYVLNTIMNSWITGISYPIFQASKNYSTGISTLSQRDVLSIYNDSYTNTPWYLPYNSITQNDEAGQWTITAPFHWLEKCFLSGEDEVKGGLDNDKWIIYNKQLFGFYHTNYDTENWNLIAAQLQADYSKFPMISRTQIIHDSFFFALNGELKLDVMFKITNYINKELNYAPINRFLSQFLELDTKLFGSNVYSNFTKYTLHKIKHIYDRQRIANLNVNLKISVADAKLRKQLITIACYMGHQHCLDDTNKLLVAAINETDGINKLLDSELGSIILNYGFVLADEELFWKIIQLYNSGNQEYLSDAVGYVQNPDLIDQLLNILTKKNGELLNAIEINLEPKFRSNTLISLAQQNSSGLDKTLSMLKAKSDILKDLFGNISLVLAVIRFKITTNERLVLFEEVLSLYEKDLPEGFQNHLDEARVQVEWANKKIPEFQKTLANLLDSIADEENANNNDDGAATLTISTVTMLPLLFVVYLCN